MPTVIPVKFRYSAHELWFDPAGVEAFAGDHVICETERGLEIGMVSRNAFEVPEAELGESLGERELKPLARLATEEDLDKADKLAKKADELAPIFRRVVHESDLDIKPVGVEYLFDGSKIVCYFSALERVDFRQLVKDLAHEMHERIDMRQIGVREEAALIGGFAHCGQELCCARFGSMFEPVTIRMAKEQDLPLNSTKISGACGRLMCCLRYEFDAYKDFKSRAPKANAVIDTPLGKAKIVEYNMPRETISMRLENGKMITVPLEDMDASEAACKKSKEQGCSCRPDTVSRSALEKLQSPEIQMALAELDRQFGEAEEGIEPNTDLFSDTLARKRRLEDKQLAKSFDEADQADMAKIKQEKRRKRPGRGQKEAAKVPREQLAEEQKPELRRRRRHRADERSKPQAEAPREQRQEEKPRPRRRPGDLGGQVEADVERKPRRRRTQASAAAEAPQTDNSKSPQRRRRRRTHHSASNEGQE